MVNSQNVDRIISAIQGQIGVHPAPNAANANRGGRQAPMQEHEARGRFMSIDTVAFSVLGPNDASRQTPAKPNPHRKEGVDHEKEEGNKVRIRGSQYMQNAFNDLCDLIGKF